MDPKVLSKILTHHQRGHGVDVEALHDQCPPGWAAEKAPRWDLLGIEGCGGGNRVSWCSWMFSGMWTYIGGSRSVEPRGAHEEGGRAQGVGAPPASCTPHPFINVHPMSSGSHLFQKSRSQRFHSVWTPFDNPFLLNTEIGKKNNNLHWALG